MLDDALAKPRIETDLVRLRKGRVQHDAALLGVHDKQVDGSPCHCTRKSIGVGLYFDGGKAGHGHFFDTPHEVMVHVVVDFVDGAADEVVGSKDAELVLDFVVVIIEAPNTGTAREHGIHARALALVDQNLRRGAVDVHHLVGHQASSAVSNAGKCEHHPPILAEQLDVWPQIFKAEEWGLRILCHLARK